MNYTKGEWKVFSAGGDEFYVEDITQLNGRSPGQRSTRLSAVTTEANSHLIAASPRMIEFIEQLANSGNQKAKDFIQTLDLS